MKKVINLLTLLVMVSVNTITPFTYADIETGDVFDIENPVIEKPVIEQPAIEEPAIEQPAIEEPAIEQPATEEPAIEQLAIEEPAIEQLATEEPIIIKEEKNDLIGKLEMGKIETKTIQRNNFENCADFDTQVGSENPYVLKKYNCDGNVFIPDTVEFLNDNAFNGITITSLRIHNQARIYENTFSGAIIDGEITFPYETIYGGRGPYKGLIVGEHGNLTLNIPSTRIQGVFRNIEVRSGGKLTINTDGPFNNNFNNSKIEGELILSGLGLNSSFQGSTLSEKGKIILGDTITTIYNSFTNYGYQGGFPYLSGHIKLPENLTSISDSFSNISLNSGFTLPRYLTNIDDSFILYQLSGNIKILDDNIPSIIRSFKGISNYINDSRIDGNIILSGTNIDTLESSFGNFIINGDFLCNNCNINTWRNNNFDRTQILGNLKLNNFDNDLYIGNGSFSPKHIGNFEIQSNSFWCENIGGGTTIGGDFKIETKTKLKIESGGFSQIKTSGDVILSGNDLTIINSALGNSSIGGDFIITSKNLTGGGGSLNDIKVSKDTIISGENISLTQSSLGGLYSNNLLISANKIYSNYGALDRNTITGTANISGNEIYLSNTAFNKSKVGNLRITTKIFTGESYSTSYPFSGLNVENDIEILGDDIYLTGAFTNVGVGGDLKINSNNINLGSLAFKNLNTIGDVNLSGNNLILEYASLDSMNVGRNLILPKNITIGSNGALNNTIVHGNTILGGAETILPTFTMQGDLIIENGDNAIAQIFTGTEVGSSKVYLSGELSKIGNKAYSFKQGTIQNTVRLKETFNASDIGDNAFCITGQPAVKGTTKKQITSGEKQDLLTRTCLDLNYDGTYNLLLKVDDNQAIVEYDGIHDVVIPETLKKDGYDIVGWYSDKKLTQETDINNQTFGVGEYQKIIYGKYVAQPSGNHSSGGGGGKKSEPSTSEITNDTAQEHNSADDNTTKPSDTTTAPLNEETTKEVISVTQEVADDGTEVEVVVEAVAIKNTNIVATVRTETPVNGTTSSTYSSSTHTQEQTDAYSFAKANGITTTESIETAKMNTELTRIQMAKILSNFAINVLGEEPDVSKGTADFDDVTNKMDEQYDNAVTKAYQLGIMGQNVKDNEFRPNDEVSRAEFTASLSRLLYKTDEGEYKGTNKYYVPHIVKLYNEGIVNKADPKIKEKRGYVMTMLKRTVE